MNKFTFVLAATLALGLLSSCKGVYTGTDAGSLGGGGICIKK
jgi:hypothetical protein